MKWSPLFYLTLMILISLKPAYSSESNFYNFSWLDQDKEVYVLQNRKYRKKGKFHINFGGGITTSGAFVSSNNMQTRLGYFFKEEFGFEALYSINSGSENDTANSIRNEGSSGSVPFRRIVEDYSGAMLLWAPFYSKINTFNKVIYLDWIFGLGFAKLTETNNELEFTTGNNDAEDVTNEHTGVLWQTSLKFYLSESFDVRATFNGVHFQAEKATTASVTEEVWSHHYDLSFSLGYSF